jgi:hypothetical protein
LNNNNSTKINNYMCNNATTTTTATADIIIIMSRCTGVTVDGVWIGYWIYSHNSELQVRVLTVPSLVSKLYKSLAHAKSSQFSLVVSWQRSLI